jgi:hypothetical protein
MLDLPKRGMARSVTQSNVRLDILADWIEASTLFQPDTSFSAADAVDLLCSEHVFAGQPLAWQTVNDAWSLLRLRRTVLGAGCAFEVVDKRLDRLADWQARPGQSFCVLLSCQVWYQKWAEQFGKDYTQQGELFEDLTRESLEALFPRWDIHATGWSRTRVNKLKAVVDAVASKLGETVGDVDRWTRAAANEAGLDMMLYRSFADGRTGLPVFLFQCASGGDWEDKLHTPSLRIWTKAILFPSDPKKAFATPFAILTENFSRNANTVNGLLLDRLRLLAPSAANPDWVQGDLRNRIVAWMQPRVNVLPFKQ